MFHQQNIKSRTNFRLDIAITVCVCIFSSGYGEVTNQQSKAQRAFVTVSRKSLNEKLKTNNRHTVHSTKEDALLPLSVEGEFSSLGSQDFADGVLKVIHESDLKTCIAPKANKRWIGLLFVRDDVDKQDNRGNQHRHSSTQSLYDVLIKQISDVMLLGASALIVAAQNIGIKHELDISQMFAKPIVFVKGVENVTKIFRIIKNQYNHILNVKIECDFDFYSAVHTVGTITLWSRCGRSTAGPFNEWQGTVCGVGKEPEGVGAVHENWKTFIFLLLTFGLTLFFRVGWAVLHADLPHPRPREIPLEQMTYRAVQRMKIFVYRCRAGKKQNAAGSGSDLGVPGVSECYSEQKCAVCLDNFYNMQKLRLVPCRHYFHVSCVDPWLLARRTCPLCKYDILKDDVLKL